MLNRHRLKITLFCVLDVDFNVGSDNGLQALIDGKLFLRVNFVGLNGS